MGQILHGSATTTHAVRAAIQRSKAPLKELAARYGLNHKTVAKWRKRAFVDDAPMGPKSPRSTVLTAEEEAAVVAFRKHTLLPLDDCLYALQATIPHLTRSSLHRCLQRHGISRLPEIAGDKPAKKPFKRYPSATSTSTSPRCGPRRASSTSSWPSTGRPSSPSPGCTRQPMCKTAVAFLEALVAAVPYKIHTVLTDNGVQFGDMPQNRSGPTARYRLHIFDRVCRQHGIEHRLTKPNHPWTNGQVERMNRTLKEATVKRYHYDTHRQLKAHLAAFLDAYNFAKRLKTLTRPHTLRSHLQSLGRRAGPLLTRPNPLDLGTEHLGSSSRIFEWRTATAGSSPKAFYAFGLNACRPVFSSLMNYLQI